MTRILATGPLFSVKEKKLSEPGGPAMTGERSRRRHRRTSPPARTTPSPTCRACASATPRSSTRPGRAAGAHRRHGRRPARRHLDRAGLRGSHRLNGNGEMTGLEWIRESGDAHHADRDHQHPQRRRGARRAGRRAGAAPAGDGLYWSLPVVGETWDGLLNDINGHHVRPEHVHAALAAAQRRAGRRGQRRRRHRHDLPRVQGRHRHRVAGRRDRERAATRSACWCRPTTARASCSAVNGVPVGE